MARGHSRRARQAVNYWDDADEGDSDSAITQHSNLDPDPDANPLDDSDRDEYDHDHAASTTKSKKAKGRAARKSTTRKGKLSGMKELPLDIWFTVAEHLDPLSLLSMSRANKSFRTLFTSRRAKPLWSTVVASVALPTLDEDDHWNDMAMVSLIYGPPECHICGKPRASLVDYVLRIRWCAKCRKEELIRDIWIDLYCKQRSNKTLTSVVSTTENRNNRRRDKVYVNKKEVIVVNEKLLELERQVLDAETEEDERDAQHELDTYVAEREAYVEAAANVSLYYSSGPDLWEDPTPDEETPQLGSTLARWSKQSQAARSAAADETKRARRDAIEKRLADLGYTETEIDGLDEYRSTIEQPTALTESIWSRISPVLIAKCDEIRTRRIEREALRAASRRRTALRPRYDALCKTESDESLKTYPSFAIWSDLPAVAKFWQDEGSVVTDETWNEGIDDIKKDIPAALRWIQLTYARQYVAARDAIGHPLAQELVESITPPDYTPAPSTAGRLFLGSDDPYNFEGFTGVDVEDPATISDVDLARLLARWTCGFLGSSYRATPQQYPEVYTLGRTAGELVPPAVKYVSIRDNWLATQLSLLAATGIEDGPTATTLARFEALGTEFACRGCHDKIPYGTYTSQGDYVSSKPKKVSRLLFSEMLAHAFQYHRHAFFSHSHNLAQCPEIVFADAVVVVDYDDDDKDDKGGAIGGEQDSAANFGEDLTDAFTDEDEEDYYRRTCW
ncbi:hypothetical protein JCM11491_003936 [Sporobolomyces phaffii]